MSEEIWQRWKDDRWFGPRNLNGVSGPPWSLLIVTSLENFLKYVKFSIVGAMLSVRDLSRNGVDPPESFIWRPAEQMTPIDNSPPSSLIPAVDFELLFSPDEGTKIREMDSLRSALKSWGLFQIIGHGIPTTLLDELDKLARQYFDLPKEEREKSSKAVYTAGDVNEEGAEIQDWCDQLYLQVHPEADKDTSLWPEDPCAFRKTVDEYVKNAKVVMEKTLKAIGQILNLEDDYFLKECGDKFIAFARFNYYPKCSRPDLVHGIKPHSDGSLITILLPDQNVEGLQVCKDGKWYQGRALPYALIINLGDQMEVMSNGIFKSPVHRAATNSVKERLSSVIFIAIDPEKEIGPADRLIDEANGKPRLYKRFKVKEYLDYFQDSFKKGRRGIQWTKV